MNAIKRTFHFIHHHPLAKRHLIRAYINFFKWQILSRLYSGFIQVPFVADTRFLAKRGLTGITGNIYTGLHEFEDMGFLLHLLKENDVFFDIGANAGSYTVLASGVRKAHSVCFEPIPDTYYILVKNITLNQINHIVTCENKGIGSKTGTLYFTSDQDTTNHVIANGEPETNAIAVPVVTLDNYYPDIKPLLIKIDVEGFETEVLNGATCILNDAQLKAIIIELNGSGKRYGYDENAIHQKLLEYDFKPYYYQPFTRSLTLQDKFGTMNTIYIKDLPFVKNRLKNALPVKVFNTLI